MDKQTNQKIEAVARLMAEDITGKPVDWEKLARAFELWVRKYPEEARIHGEEMEDLRDALKDAEFGKGQTNIRLVAHVPMRIDKLFSVLEPEYRNKKNINTFLKRFPVFKVPERR